MMKGEGGGLPEERENYTYILGRSDGVLHTLPDLLAKGAVSIPALPQEAVPYCSNHITRRRGREDKERGSESWMEKETMSESVCKRVH